MCAYLLRPFHGGGPTDVLQTDGFSDNVFPSEMMTICSLVARAGGTEDEQVQAMADRLVDYSRQCMKSKSRVSPFERKFSIPLLSFSPIDCRWQERPPE